jgi:hypothetical protein
MLESGFIIDAIRALDGNKSDMLLRCAEDDDPSAFLALLLSSSELTSLNFNLCKDGG